MAVAVALLAVTINFLQPIAHAALMRNGAPSALWTVFCHASAADPEGTAGSTPVAVQDHQCCLGLAHAVAFIEPAADYLAVAFANLVAVPLPTTTNPGSIGNRDGPHRPRGPPSLS
jgi:hypothetical protein